MSDKDTQTHYPQSWEEYIGQTEAVYQLKVHCRAALARGKPLDHVLIATPVAGAGKSSLARLICIAMGVQARIVNEPIPPRSVPLLMDELREANVGALIMDEFHKQFDGRGKKNIEWLLTFLETGKIPTSYGLEDGPALTVIAATTDVGVLGDPFLRRFGIKPTMVPYTDEEAALIAAQLARKILVSEGLAEPTPEQCTVIARAADNNPGEAQTILKALRSLVFAGETDTGAGYDVAQAIHFAGLTPDGLTDRDIAYLKLLVQARGRPLGRQTVKELLGEVAGGLAYLDGRLHRKGLIFLSDRGRELTPQGRRRALELAAAA